MSGSISSLRRSDSRRASRSPSSRGSSCATAAREKCRPDDRRALQDRPLLRAQPLDARGEQRVDGGRHLEVGERDAGRPALAFALAARRRAPACARARRRTGDCPRWPPARAPRSRPGSSSAPITFAASRVAAPASRPPSVTTSPTRPPGAPSDERVSRSSGRAATSTSSGTPAAPLHQVLDRDRAAAARPTAGRRARAPRAAPSRAPASRRRTTKKVSSGGAGVPASSAATPFAIRARSGSSPGMHFLDRRAHDVAVGARHRARAARGARRRAARRSARRRRRNAPVSTVARVAEAAHELVEQPRLPEPGRAEDRGEPRGGRRDRRVVHRSESPQLVLAADERDRRRAGGPLERHDPVGRHRLGATLQREGAEWAGHLVAHQAPRRLADQHVAFARLLLQAAGHVQRVADALGPLVAHDDLARVHRDAQAERADDRALLAPRTRGRPAACRPPRAPRGSRRPPRRAARRTRTCTPSPSSCTTVPPCASTGARIAA